MSAPEHAATYAERYKELRKVPWPPKFTYHQAMFAVNRIVEWTGGSLAPGDLDLLAGWLDGNAREIATRLAKGTHRERYRWWLSDKRAAYDYGYRAGLKVANERHKKSAQESYRRGFEAGKAVSR